MGPSAVSVIGALTGPGYLAVMLNLGRRSFRRSPIEPRFPSTHPDDVARG